jgi:hypothetical protein
MISPVRAKPPSPAPAEAGPHPAREGGESDRHAGPGDGDQPTIQIDYIDESIEESFPASDPPATAPTTSLGAPGHHAGGGRG